jgi:hypothetical protein
LSLRERGVTCVNGGGTRTLWAPTAAVVGLK